MEEGRLHKGTLSTNKIPINSKVDLPVIGTKMYLLGFRGFKRSGTGTILTKTFMWAWHVSTGIYVQIHADLVMYVQTYIYTHTLRIINCPLNITSCLENKDIHYNYIQPTIHISASSLGKGFSNIFPLGYTSKVP